MAWHLRIPLLVDLVRSSDPAEIRAFAQDQRLDRSLSATGALLNRILTAKLGNILVLDGKPLPAVLPREDAERARVQAKLQERLDANASAGNFDEEGIATVAEAVRGAADAQVLGRAVQQAVGRLFAADYEATAESWAAAQLLDKAAHSMNPIAAVVWRVTGQIARAQRLLGEKVRGDRAGVHATGIVVHNLVRSFMAMRDLLRAKVRDKADAVATRCLVAPESVLRKAVAENGAGPNAIRKDMLVVLDLRTAQQRDNSPEIVFMAGSWSQCPATAWIPAFMRAVWEHAVQLPAVDVQTVGGPFRLASARAQATHWRRIYHAILGCNLILQLALGIAMLAAPVWISGLLAEPSIGAAFVRVWGLLLLLLTALYAAGWADPIYTRWPNVVGIVGRLATALLYLCLGGGFLWLALYDAIFAVVLAWTYVQAITTELMTRP